MDLRDDVRMIWKALEEDVARKKMTPEERAADEARRAETTRMVEERIAYHTAKAKEEEEARQKQAS